MSHLEFCSLILIVLHTFSIMFKSGDWDGQFRQFNSFSLFHWTTLWEAWHGALSSWKIYPPFGIFLAITGHILSSWFIVPSISVNVPTPSNVIHPQNITATRGPPFKPTHSGRQISSTFLQTCTRLSWPTTTCVSSENITRFQYNWTYLCTNLCETNFSFSLCDLSLQLHLEFSLKSSYFLSSTGQLCEMHDMVHYQPERWSHRSKNC